MAEVGDVEKVVGIKLHPTLDGYPGDTAAPGGAADHAERARRSIERSRR